MVLLGRVEARLPFHVWDKNLDRMVAVRPAVISSSCEGRTGDVLAVSSRGLSAKWDKYQAGGAPVSVLY